MAHNDWAVQVGDGALRARGAGLALLLTGALLLTACAPAAPSPTAAPKPAAPAAAKPAGPLQKVKITIPALSATQIHMFIARDKGFFAKHGIEAEIAVVPATTGLQAMIAGDYDFTGAIGTTVSGALRGAPIKAVMVNMDRPLAWLYAKPTIKSIGELKGKTVAVSAAGGVDEINAKNVIRDGGVDPERDVVFINQGTPGERLGPLLAGAVDAAVLASPGNILAKQAGNVELAFLGEKLRGAFVGIGVTTKTLSERRDVVRSTLAAIIEAVDFYNTNPVETKAMLKEILEIDPALLDGVYETVKLGWTVDGTESPDVMKQDIRDQAKVLEVDPNTNPDTAFDFSVVREAMALIKAR